MANLTVAPPVGAGHPHSVTHATATASKLSHCFGRTSYHPPEKLPDEYKDVEFPDPTVKLQFYAVEWFGLKHKYLGERTPDTNGRFSIDIDTQDICDFFQGDQSKLRIDVLKQETVFSDNDGKIDYVKVQTIEKIITDSAKNNDLGKLQMTYGPIHQGFTEIAKPSPDHRPPVSYLFDLGKALLGNTSVALFAKAVEKIAPGKLSNEAVQTLFNLVNGHMSRVPTIDDYRWEVLEHELTQSIMAVEPTSSSEDEVVWVADFSKYAYDVDTDNSLPTRTEVHAKKQIDQTPPKIEKIVIHFRDEDKPTVVTKDSPLEGRGRAWAAANVMTAFCTRGEAGDHLGYGHMRFDKAARAFFLCVPPSHELYPILAPFFAGLFFINELGKNDIVFSTNIDSTDDLSVLGAGELSERGVVDFMHDHGASADWSVLRKREVLYKNHHYAIARNAVIEAYEPFFKDLIAGFVREKKFENENFWLPIARWSQMVSVYDKEFRPFAIGRTKPEGEDLNNLPLFFTSVVDTVSEHFLKHTAQNILLWNATLAPRNKQLRPDGSFAPDGNTPADKRAQVTAIAATLLEVKVESILEKKGITDIVKAVQQKAVDLASTLEAKELLRKMYYTVPI